MNRTVTLCMSPIVYCVISATGNAQAAGVVQPAGNEDAQVGIEDIVVTAQRRSENLQDVPLSVVAITSERVEAAGVRSLEDLGVMTPGLNVTRQDASVNYFIRGVGTPADQAGQEKAVAVFIDGVYQATVSSAALSLSNIDRVEVLKGPQGTLFGRNATGGAINVITRTPSRTPTANFSIGYGNKETVDASFYLSGGLGSIGAIDLAGNYHNQNEGFGVNLFNGREVNKDRSFALRSKLLLDLAPETQVTLTGFHYGSSGSYGTAFRGYPGTILANGQPASAFPGGFWDVDSDVQPIFDSKETGGDLHIEQGLGNVKLLSISSYTRAVVTSDNDADLINLPIAGIKFRGPSDTYTQELQLSSDSDGPLTWVLGGFFLYQKAGWDPQQIIGSAVGIGPDPDATFTVTDTQKTTSYAAYGQASLDLTERTRLTLGGRYTIDKRELQANPQISITTIGVIPLPTVSDSATFKRPTWRVALDHELAPDIMAYLSYNRGFLSGVYNLSAPYDPVVRPEILDAYEAGVKSTLFDRRLRLNAAGFYYDYDNIQVRQIVGTTTRIVNAASARLYGVDVDFEAAIANSLTIQGGFEWLHARYGTFNNAPFSFPNPNPPYGNSVTPQPATGNEMIRAPKFTANVSANYETPVSAQAKLLANLSYGYNDGFVWDSDNRLRQGPVHMINSRLGLELEGGMSLAIWGRNLLQEKSYSWVTSGNPFGDLAAAAPGRTYGATIGYKF